jgi:hypothetical protein
MALSILSKDGDYNMDTLRLSSSALTNTDKEAAELLLKTQFPGCPPAEKPMADQFHPHLPTAEDTLERLVDHFIGNDPLIEQPLSSMQHAYRKGKSTETALHELVYQIESSISVKKFALGAVEEHSVPANSKQLVGRYVKNANNICRFER